MLDHGPRLLARYAGVHHRQVFGYRLVAEGAVIRHLYHLLAASLADMVPPAPFSNLHLHGLVAHDVVIVQARLFLFAGRDVEFIAAVGALAGRCCGDLAGAWASLARRRANAPTAARDRTSRRRKKTKSGSIHVWNLVIN